MATDQNKHISQIKYNHLNLPTQINFDDGRNIAYTYDAAGTKLKKDVDFGTHHEITNYLNGYQYLNKPESQGGQGVSVLEFFPTAEGYVKSVYKEVFPFGGAKFQYVYNYTDHLGNIRMSYTQFEGSLVALEETHYYPFGLKHGSYYTSATKKMSKKEAGGDLKIKPTADTNYKYKYQGQEYQDELDLNLYDYQWRDYDPAIARFNNIDRFAEKYSSTSPYSFVANSPVYFREIRGDSLNVTGAEIKAVNAFKSEVNNGLDGFYTFDIDKKGNTSLTKTDKKGKRTKEQKSFYKNLNKIIKNKKTTFVSIVANDTTVEIGRFETGEMDILDIIKLGSSDLKKPEFISAQGAISHELSEQFEKQVNGLTSFPNPFPAHDIAIKTENSVNGSQRKQIGIFQVNNAAGKPIGSYIQSINTIGSISKQVNIIIINGNVNCVKQK